MSALGILWRRLGQVSSNGSSKKWAYAAQARNSLACSNQTRLNLISETHLRYCFLTSFDISTKRETKVLKKMYVFSYWFSSLRLTYLWHPIIFVFSMLIKFEYFCRSSTYQKKTTILSYLNFEVADDRPLES